MTDSPVMRREMKMSEKIPLLIDTDPGVDDALALLMAFNDARHEVVGLTIAAGNVGLVHTVRNALKLCEVAGRPDVPVYAGAPDPLVHPSVDAAHVHGEDGFGDVGFTPAARTAEAEHAALAILWLSHEYAGKLLLVALGPLTNLALALKLDPTLPQRVGRFLVMGGAINGHGNITPVAEFNIAFDPEAAHIVFSAFPHVEIADWEATVAHGLPHREVEQWLAGEGCAHVSTTKSRARPACGPRTAVATAGTPPMPWRWPGRWRRKGRPGSSSGPCRSSWPGP